jgi:hypothetical protein
LVADAIRSAGYYELPVPIVVADDVLGTVCWTQIGDLRAQIHTPLLTRDAAGDRPAAPPHLPGIPIDHPRVASPWDWVMTIDGADRRATCLRRVGVVLDQPAERPPRLPIEGGPRASRLGMAALDGMDEWVESLSGWVEVLTGQDLDHHHPRYDVSYLGAGLWISNEVLPDMQLGQIEPMDFQRWQATLQRIGNKQEPSLVHLLARDARTAFRRGDLRRAAINAGTTADMILNRLYHDTVPVGGRHHPRTSLDQPSLTSLKNALFDHTVKPAVTSEALEALIMARNAATYDGRETDEDQLRAILTTMTTLLAAHGPDPL